MRHALLTLVLLAAACAVAAPTPAAAQDKDSFQRRCDEGDLAACNILGLMYETGSGVGQNMGRAREIYREACEAGETAACTSLGLLLAHGDGMPQDREGAAARYRMACEAGDRFGCDLLAALEREGPPTEPQEFYKTGRVGDSNSARMLAGALVDVPALGVRGLTDAEGRIALGRVKEGYYDVRAEALGYEVMRGTIIVPGYSEFVVLLNPMDWETPSAPGRIDGSVVDDVGQGIADVDVRVISESGAHTLTNELGRFSLQRVDPGLTRVQFSRLGYADRETMLIVQPGGTARIDATMAADAVDLAPIEVTVEEHSAYLERSGFYRRQRRGFGRQLTVDDFVGEGQTVGALLSELRGLRVTADIFRREFVTSTRTVPQGGCRFDSYVDGTKTRDGNVNWASPAEIEGIEVYQGQDVPIEYSHVGNCGVILIWTIRP